MDRTNNKTCSQARVLRKERKEGLSEAKAVIAAVQAFSFVR